MQKAEEDLLQAADGFEPDPAAWRRYGDLVRSTKGILKEASRSASAMAVPQPAGFAAPAVVGVASGDDEPHGYEARGYGDLCDQIEALRTNQTTPLDEVRKSLHIATSNDADLHGVEALEEERALDTAEQLSGLAPDERGPLAGAPYARKDLFFREGYRAECGTTMFEGQLAYETATVLKRLDQAGGIDIGRLAMAELAMSPTGFNVHHDHPRNPWHRDHVTGGSSSGSAVAVAAGYVNLALGTDTGGSVRHPAAMSGITGLKPTINRISRKGVWPLSWSLDCVGPLTRSARDCALILELISGPDEGDSSVISPTFSRPALNGDLTGKRIAVPEGYYFETVTPTIAKALDAARQELSLAGAEIVSTVSPDMTLVNAMAHLVLAAESCAQLGQVFASDECMIGRQVRDRLEPGMFYSASEYANALRLRPTIRQQWLTAAMAECDAVFIPAIPCEVPSIAATTQGDMQSISTKIAAVTHATRGINYLGLPGLSTPCGFDDAGLPIAFQLIGRADDEATLIDIADAYQRRTNWHIKSPFGGDR